MSTHIVAILDDRPDERETLALGLRSVLDADTWSVRTMAPPPSVDQAVTDILSTHACVLILDQRLNEHAVLQAPVRYTGHEVAKAVRHRQPDLPIYMVSAISSTINLNRGMAESLDHVIHRGEFAPNIRVYAARIIRSGTTFVERHRHQLARLQALSIQVAEGVATADERAELQAIQTSLSLVSPVAEASGSLDELAHQLQQLEALRERIDASRKGPPDRRRRRVARKRRQ